MGRRCEALFDLQLAGVSTEVECEWLTCGSDFSFVCLSCARCVCVMEMCGDKVELCGDKVEMCGDKVELCGGKVELCGVKWSCVGVKLSCVGVRVELCGGEDRYGSRVGEFQACSQSVVSGVTVNLIQCYTSISCVAHPQIGVSVHLSILDTFRTGWDRPKCLDKKVFISKVVLHTSL